jgi:hypothetical protein|tara:strand:+ start:151 stop:354 length:204 start_codon:yes stop_codon:yes gene_type:complete
MIFETVKVTKKLKIALDDMGLEDVTVGSWEVMVLWEGNYTEWYGPYDTKKDAQEAVSGMKKSGAFRD